MRIETDRLIIRSIERGDYIPCTIVLKSTGDIVGNVGCTYYEDTGKVGICYFAGTQFRKKGYISEAVKAYVP